MIVKTEHRDFWWVAVMYLGIGRGVLIYIFYAGNSMYTTNAEGKHLIY